MIDLLLGLGALVGLVAYGSIAVAVHTIEHDQPVTRDRLATTILGAEGHDECRPGTVTEL